MRRLCEVAMSYEGCEDREKEQLVSGVVGQESDCDGEGRVCVRGRSAALRVVRIVSGA